MKHLFLVSAAALMVASPAAAKPLKWMDGTAVGLPAGAQLAVVKGDPTKADNFVVQIKMPANYVVPPHHHPTDEVVRVLGAGTLDYGMGDKLDKGNVGHLTKGYHVTMAPNMNHYVVTSDPVTVQVNAMGPFEITYVDPKDDPRKK